MNLNQWLTAALRDLDPQARARLDAEYTAHFHDALDVTGSEAQALASLGDPERLNGQLKRQYLTTDEVSWIDRYAATIAQPYWGWILAGVMLFYMLFITQLRGTTWLNLGLVGGSTVLVVLGRALAIWYLSRRKAASIVALLALTVFIPATQIGISLTALKDWRVTDHLAVVVGFLFVWYGSAFHYSQIWLKVLRRG